VASMCAIPTTEVFPGYYIYYWRCAVVKGHPGASRDVDSLLHVLHVVVWLEKAGAF